MLNLIALALSGYTPQETRLWHETCSGIKSNIANPYLRAVFNFLCGTGRDGFPAVLNETEMSLQDRVAFACTYLDDGQVSPTPLDVSVPGTVIITVPVSVFNINDKVMFFTMFKL